MALFENRKDDYIQGIMWLLLIILALFLNLVVILRHWSARWKIAPLLILLIAASDILKSASKIYNIFVLLSPDILEKEDPSIICKISSGMFVMFFRASLYGHLFLSIHRVKILKNPTAKLSKLAVLVPLTSVAVYLLVSTIIMCAGPNLVWYPAAQIAWYPNNDRVYWYAELVSMGIDSGVAVIGITVSTVITVSHIRNHVKESLVKNSDKIKRSAVTVQWLTANTLLLFTTWFLLRIAIKVIQAYREKGELPFNETPKLWKSFLFWLPSLLNSVFNPLILIVRNNINVKTIFWSQKE